MPRESVVELAARVDASTSGSISEDSLAQEFARTHGKDYRYVPGRGFLLWTGHKWQKDEKLRHFDAMRRIARAHAAEIAKDGESRRIAAAKTVTAMATLARSDPLLVRGVEEFDADPLLLNTPAGLVDLRTAELRPHDRDLVTKSTTVAPNFGGRCDVWLRFMEQVFAGESDVIDFVYRFLGYCLTGLTKEHALGFFFGDGANGKSTLLDFLLWLLGDYALKLPASVLMTQRGERHPTELAQFLGIRFAVSSEVDEGEYWAEARLKELTGDTTLTARYVRGDFFTFKLLCKIVIGGNHRPQMRSVDDALKRRLVLVPFMAKFLGDRRDPDMLDRLKAEGPAVLASLIEGCQEYLEHGLQVPASILVASEEYAAAAMSHTEATACGTADSNLPVPNASGSPPLTLPRRLSNDDTKPYGRHRS
jgi:putative DNA primase/helicase